MVMMDPDKSSSQSGNIADTRIDEPTQSSGDTTSCPPALEDVPSSSINEPMLTEDSNSPQDVVPEVCISLN